MEEKQLYGYYKRKTGQNVKKTWKSLKRKPQERDRISSYNSAK